jgi:hypothetical protein
MVSNYWHNRTWKLDCGEDVRANRRVYFSSVKRDMKVASLAEDLPSSRETMFEELLNALWGRVLA